MRLSLLLALLTPLPLLGAEPEGDKLKAIRASVEQFVEKGDIAGAVTVVGRKDGVLSYETIGMANLETKTPMARDTIFKIASMTKPITAFAIMILVDEGKLKLDDPVEKHLPEFKGQMMIAERGKVTLTLKKPARPITIKDLLTHTSGLPGGPPPGLSDLYTKRHYTLAEATAVQSQRPLEFEPGSKWAYCNMGIDTLGRIVEVAAEMPFEEFLRKRIFGPLFMRDTTFYPTEAQQERLAQTYHLRDGKLAANANSLLAVPAGARHPVPAGGLYSTGEDLAKFYRMMLNNGVAGMARYLSEESVKAMTTNQIGELKGAFTPGMGFGLGWAVVREPQGVTAMLSPGSYGHGGAFGTQAWLDPRRDLFVVLLIQRTGLPNADASPMRHALQEAAVAAIK